MKCGYCLQTSEQAPADHKASPIEFVEKLIPVIGKTAPKEIFYWGGEPMLYWGKVKVIHSALKAKGIAADRITVAYKGDTVQPYNTPEENRVSICIAE